MGNPLHSTINKLFTFLLLTCPIAVIGQTADFTPNLSSGCAPLTVTFTDKSTAGSSSWTWDFGNSNPTITNPDNQPVSAVYTDPGTYNVSLKLSNGNIKTKQIVVFKNPATNFTSSPVSGCVGQSMSFTSTSVIGDNPIIEYRWKYGEGNTEIYTIPTTSHAYTSAKTFPVTLTVSDINCSNTITQNVVIVNSPTASFTTTPTSPAKCNPPLDVQFNNSSTISGSVTYSWDFGDGTPLSTIASPLHSYTKKGSFTPKLTVIQGSCQDSKSIDSLVKVQDIVVDFTGKTSACANENISFTSSIVPTAISQTWTFGDNTTSALANPVHFYTAPGNYNVILKATDASGCTNSDTTTITINPLPVANFGASSPIKSCLPFTVNFTDSSTNATGYFWSFGDGTTSTAVTPSHKFNATGNYTVTLILASNKGCLDTIIRSNFVSISPPVASFTINVNKGCVPLAVQYKSTSVTNTPIVKYDWRFGDGGTGTGATTNHTYSVVGSFADTLIITTDSGCIDTVIRPIKVGNKPIAKFTVVDSTVCYKQKSDFIDQTTGPVDSWIWSYGDGVVDSLLIQNPSHVYADTGIFTVQLIALYNGCADTLKKNSLITIFPPKAKFSFQLSCINKYTVSFLDASAKADSIVWKLGTDTLINSNIKNFTYQYKTTGSKTVMLLAYNFSTGCIDSTTQSFTIADPKTIFATDTNKGCYPLTVKFTDTSQDANIYKWTFGDGGKSSTGDTVHTYNLPSPYNLSKFYFPKLTITDVNGCKDSLSKQIQGLGPKADFNVDITKGCAPLSVLFSDKSESDSTLVRWIWDYGDGKKDTTNLSSKSHIFTKTGSYAISMTVTDTNKCSSTQNKTSYINPTFPIPTFVADTFSCKGKSIAFDAAATNAVSPTYFWNFGENNLFDSTTTASIQHTYTSDSLYTVTLKVRDVNGCIDSIKKIVRILQPVALFSDSLIDYKCGEKTVNFTDASTGFVNKWSWDFGDGSSSTLSNPKNIYTQAGKYKVTLTVTNVGGCTNTTSIDSLVVVPGPIGDFSFTPTIGCNPLKVQFVARSNNSDTYTWDFRDGVVQTTSSKNIEHIYTRQLALNPILLLGNTLPNGKPCQLQAANLTGVVTVKTIIGVNITPGIINAEEGEIYFFNPIVTNLIGKPSYSWQPSEGLTCNTCEKPGAKPSQTTTYYLTVKDSNGCVGQDSVIVLFSACVDADPIRIPNVFTPNGDGVNDEFKIEGDCYRKDYSLTIYNRWGNLLFSSVDYNETWDGRSKAGSFVSEGIYFYILKRGGKITKGTFNVFK